jgi:hypothetical protein
MPTVHIKRCMEADTEELLAEFEKICRNNPCSIRAPRPYLLYHDAQAHSLPTLRRGPGYIVAVQSDHRRFTVYFLIPWKKQHIEIYTQNINWKVQLSRDVARVQCVD